MFGCGGGIGLLLIMVLLLRWVLIFLVKHSPLGWFGPGPINIQIIIVGVVKDAEGWNR